MAPYVEAGTSALGGMRDIAGLGGTDAQNRAIDAIAMSPEMAARTKAGEDAILANASATGGLRGGNVQGALSQYRPQVLADLISQQYARLGGIAQMGQASATGVGAGALQTGQGVAGMLQQQGAAQAGGILANGQALQSIPNAFMNALGMYAGLGGFGGAPASPVVNSGVVIPQYAQGSVSGF